MHKEDKKLLLVIFVAVVYSSCFAYYYLTKYNKDVPASALSFSQDPSSTTNTIYDFKVKQSEDQVYTIMTFEKDGPDKYCFDVNCKTVLSKSCACVDVVVGDVEIPDCKCTPEVICDQFCVRGVYLHK